MQHVSQRDAMRDVSKYLSDMGKWCDQDGRYDRGMVNVSTDSINRLRNCVSLVLKAGSHGALIEVPDGFTSVYAYLCNGGGRKNG